MSCRTRLCIALSLTLCLLLGMARLAAARPPASEPAGYAPFPAPGPGYVTDLAHVLSVEQRDQIQRWLWQTEKETSVEIVIVTIDSMANYPGTPNDSIEHFARALFDRWGIGNMPANNGVLLLVSMQDRKARIELGAGYGHARDAAAQKIMDQAIVPCFRKSDYSGGIEQGTRALMLEFAGMRVGWNWPLIAVIAAIPLAGGTSLSLFRNGKRGWGWVAVGLLVVSILAVVWLIQQILNRLPDSSSSSWSSGGCGGGFGGGFSGGGGATGSW